MFKSAIAALEQQHFGANMDGRNLPASWSSTSNALEEIAFQAKDALIVIDDFAPQGNLSNLDRYHSGADRIFRAAGNHSGRARLDSTATLRASKPPRGLVLSTGEDIPRGHSVRARLLILEMEKGMVNKEELTNCQMAARDGLYSRSTAGFVSWIAPRYEEHKAKVAKSAEALRTALVGAEIHSRTPEIVTKLQASFNLFLDFAVHSGAIEEAERKKLEDRCWMALRTVAAAQTKHQVSAEPTERYLTLLRSLLASGKAHLSPRKLEDPNTNFEAIGWPKTKVTMRFWIVGQICAVAGLIVYLLGRS